ncbi:hypothetical protein BC831DRAFT_455135, partial [Entophlyctis helioformis]
MRSASAASASTTTTATSTTTTTTTSATATATTARRPRVSAALAARTLRSSVALHARTLTAKASRDSLSCRSLAATPLARLADVAPALAALAATIDELLASSPSPSPSSPPPLKDQIVHLANALRRPGPVLAVDPPVFRAFKAALADLVHLIESWSPSPSASAHGVSASDTDIHTRLQSLRVLLLDSLSTSTTAPTTTSADALNGRLQVGSDAIRDLRAIQHSLDAYLDLLQSSLARLPSCRPTSG